MKIEEKQITQIKITGAKNLDPIVVCIDEWQDKRPDETRYQGRIIIQCCDITLSHYWNAMGGPMKEFFINANTSYIADKLKVNARETYRPIAFEGFYDKNDNFTEKEATNVEIKMADFHYKHICKIIEAVKAAFKEQLKAKKANEN